MDGLQPRTNPRRTDERILWTLFDMTALFIIGVTSQLHPILHHPGEEQKNDKDESEERNHFDVDITKELTHISLCAGYGGIDLGLSRVLPNLRTVAFSEIEAYAVANLVAKMEEGLLDAAPIWTNLKTFPWEDFRGKVDILSGGFPCQPFSSAGRRRGDEDPRHLFPYIKRGIALLRPAFVFLENVEGIISSKLGKGWSDRAGTSVLLHVLRELERLGYKAEAGIFSASEIGAPHQRKRVFIMGFSEDGNVESSIGWRRSIKERVEIQIRESDQDVFPNRRGEVQKKCEPPRVLLKKLDNSMLNRCESIHTKNNSKKNQKSKADESFRTVLSRESLGQSSSFKSTMDRNVDGGSHRMDDDRLYRSYTSYQDELKLLGNGVVPATAARAFRVLWEEIKKDSN